MRISRLLLTSAALLLASPAMAADITLCAGKAGGGYDGLMQTIGAELVNKGNNVTVLNLAGSEDILNALADGKCSYGPAQKDVSYLMTKQNPALAVKDTPILVLYNEAMTLVCSKESGYDELSDIKAGDGIIVDTIGSGSALTWETMVGIEKEFGNGSSWAQATPEYSALDEAGAALSLGTAKCAFGVGKAPIDWASQMEDLGGVVSEVYDKDINDLEFNGQSLYEPAKMPDGAYKNTWATYKVPAVLFRAGQVAAEADRLIKRLAPALGAKIKNTVQ